MPPMGSGPLPAHGAAPPITSASCSRTWFGIRRTVGAMGCQATVLGGGRKPAAHLDERGKGDEQLTRLGLVQLPQPHPLLALPTHGRH